MLIRENVDKVSLCDITVKRGEASKSVMRSLLTRVEVRSTRSVSGVEERKGEGSLATICSGCQDVLRDWKKAGRSKREGERMPVVGQSFIVATSNRGVGRPISRSSV
jgi:hypothetical protein